MNSVIQIKCPFDGAVLKVLNQPGIESMNVTCPICKNTYPFSKFKRIVINQNPGFEEPGTDYAGRNRHQKNPHTEFTSTQFQASENLTIGSLKLKGTNIEFHLNPGRNIIGRKTLKSNATIMIDTPDRTMSREHIMIEVRKIPGKGYVHYLSLCKEKINPTFIGHERLFFGDSVVVNFGDIIRLPGADLIMEMSDPEKTQFI